MRIVSVFILFALLGCKEEAEVQVTTPKGGWYRATLSRESGVDVPFFISLPSDTKTGGAVVMNGRHWFTTEHSWTTDRVTVEFPLYRTRIVAAVRSDGGLFGTWENYSRAVGPASLAFKAEPINEPDPEIRFPAGPSEVDPAGFWKLDISSSGSEKTTGKLVVNREGKTGLGATLWYANGVSVYLAGNVSGPRIFLSGFDGVSPYLLVGSIEGDRLEGELTSGADLTTRETMNGTRNRADFELASPIHIAAPDKRLRLPELKHPRYADQPLILMLAGSWCAHCKSAAPALAKIYERYRDQGLRLLTINYEFTNDKSYNLTRAAHFKNTYDITWEVVTRDGSLSEFWQILPNGLKGEGFVAFPITIFLKRDGTIHAMHSGFVGPESGAAHDALEAQFDAWTKDILK